MVGGSGGGGGGGGRGGAVRPNPAGALDGSYRGVRMERSSDLLRRIAMCT